MLIFRFVQVCLKVVAFRWRMKWISWWRILLILYSVDVSLSLRTHFEHKLTQTHIFSNNFFVIDRLSYILALWIWHVIWTRTINESIYCDRRFFTRFVIELQIKSRTKQLKMLHVLKSEEKTFEIFVSSFIHFAYSVLFSRIYFQIFQIPQVRNNKPFWSFDWYNPFVSLPRRAGDIFIRIWMDFGSQLEILSWVQFLLHFYFNCHLQQRPQPL